MLATVVALYNSAGLASPASLGKVGSRSVEEEGAVLVAAAVMALSMLAVSAPVFAVPEGCPGGEMQPGQSGERARAPQTVPSEAKPGSARRAEAGHVHDTSNDTTGRGDMCGGIYSAVQKGWPLMHDEPSALSNQLFGCQPLKAECSLLGKVHPFRERL